MLLHSKHRGTRTRENPGRMPPNAYVWIWFDAQPTIIATNRFTAGPSVMEKPFAQAECGVA